MLPDADGHKRAGDRALQCRCSGGIGALVHVVRGGLVFDELAVGALVVGAVIPSDVAAVTLLWSIVFFAAIGFASDFIFNSKGLGPYWNAAYAALGG